jgi:hypothetical protein
VRVLRLSRIAASSVLAGDCLGGGLPNVFTDWIVRIAQLVDDSVAARLSWNLCWEGCFGSRSVGASNGRGTDTASSPRDVSSSSSCNSSCLTCRTSFSLWLRRVGCSIIDFGLILDSRALFHLNRESRVPKPFRLIN